MLKFVILLAAVAVCFGQENLYRLYTRPNRETFVNMSQADSYLPDEFNLEDKTIILIHGHNGGSTHSFNTDIRREILARGAYNVIVVDWERRASGSYSTARSNVERVAGELREFLRWLSSSTTEEVTSPTTEEVTSPTTEVVTSTTEEVTSTTEEVTSTTEVTSPTTVEVTSTTEEVTSPTTEEVTSPTTEEVTSPTTEEVTSPTTEEVTSSTTEEVTSPTTEEVTSPTTGDAGAGAIARQSIGIDVARIHLVGFGLGAHVAGIASRQLSSSLGIVGRITGLDPSGSGWDSRSQRLRKSDAEYVEIIHTDGSGLFANGVGSAIGDKDFYANGGSNQPGCFSHSCSHNRAYELFAASMRGHLFGNSCGSKTQMNLNLCRGTRVLMGGTDVVKDRSNQILRINTGRIYPF